MHLAIHSLLFPLFYGCNHKFLNFLNSTNMLERVVAEGLEGAKIKTCVENEIIRSGWRAYGSIHENRVMMVGSKDTAAKDDRFSL